MGGQIGRKKEGMYFLENIYCSVEEYKQMCKTKTLELKINNEKNPVCVKLKKKPILVDVVGDRIRVEISTENMQSGYVTELLKMRGYSRMRLRDIDEKIRSTLINKFPKNSLELEQFCKVHDLLDEDIKELISKKEEIINSGIRCLELYRDC